MPFITFKILVDSDAELLSELLLNNPKEYTQYFYPFDFDELSIQAILRAMIKDQFFGILLKRKNFEDEELVGFYMLRGIDEGYIDPMYGVFIGHQWQGMGLARLSLCHAECFCKLNAYKRILLKVHKENVRANKLYQSIGFKILGEESQSSNVLMYKDI